MSGFSITDNKGFQIHFENGWTASVQFGKYNYCANYVGFTGMKQIDYRECKNAEIAAFWVDESGDMHWLENEEWDDTVKGHCEPSEVLRFLNKVEALPKLEKE